VSPPKLSRSLTSISKAVAIFKVLSIKRSLDCPHAASPGARHHCTADTPIPRRRGDRIAGRCPLLALSGHHDRAEPCPLSGVKRTSRLQSAISAFDPKRMAPARSAQFSISKCDILLIPDVVVCAGEAIGDGNSSHFSAAPPQRGRSRCGHSSRIGCGASARI
jgi:hypothetical protein